MPKSINFATSNLGKVKEFKEILEPEINVNHVMIKYDEIQSQDAQEIARKSAELVANMLKKNVVVEDSGLFIDELNGFPGTFSADVHKQIGLKGILKIMKGVKNRNCEYRSVVAYCEPGKKAISFLGTEKGTIALKPRGKFGFGHDPIFIPKESKKTYGEMTNAAELKKFRRIAVLKLREFLLKKK